ncbi:MAG: ion transporter [Leptospiraceae bacterium]|nr:ion transporter [Leptospiraceae bacterium]
MTTFLSKIAESAKFSNFITIVILIAGVLVGMETYPSMVEKYGDTIHLLDKIVLAIFVLEIVVKMGAEGSKPWNYFKDGWNVFDFLIVAAAFMPFGGSSVAILRLVRLLRVLKLVTAIPKLQLLVSALIRSIPSMGYVSILLLILFYIYGVAAVIFFGGPEGNDQYHFLNIQTAMVSLFRAVTLEDWTDIMYIQMYGCMDYALPMHQETLCKPEFSTASPVGGALFFISFVLIGTMIMLNLFIGVIMNGMDEAKVEFAEAKAAEEQTDVADISMNIEYLRAKLREANDLISVIEDHNKRGKA